MGESQQNFCEFCGSAFMPTEDGMKPTCICHLERTDWDVSN